MLRDQIGSMRAAMKWSDGLKAKYKGKSTLHCGVDPVPQSLLSCVKVKKPLELGEREACFKEAEYD